MIWLSVYAEWLIDEWSDQPMMFLGYNEAENFMRNWLGDDQGALVVAVQVPA